MNENFFVNDRNDVLHAHRLPGRVTTQEAARLLGFAQHDITMLTAGRLLKPLGSPAPNAPKYFATVEILRYAQDADWLRKATECVSRSWKAKNQQRQHKATSI